MSLTGGGYRGLYTATVLEDIESHLKKKNEDDCIANYFDLITGTSIGGIIALALAYEIPANEIAKIFDENGKKIFKKQALFGFFKAKYNSDTLKKILTEWFGDAKLGDLKHPVVIPSVDYTVGKPVTFKTAHNCNFIRDWELRIVDVALATSAAPTFFKRHTINKSEYVDGGLFANSPSLIGLHEAENYFEQNTENVRILSIGTMSSKKTINPNANKKGGLVDWGEGNFINAAENIIELTLSSQQLFTQQIVKHRIKENLVEIDENLTESSAMYVALDNVTDSAKQILISNANQSSKVALSKEDIQAFFIEHVEAPHFFNG